MNFKFFIGLSFVFLSIIFQFYSAVVFGNYMSFALSALVALAFFLSPLEILSLACVVVFLLHTGPHFSIEFLLLIVLPLAASFVRRLFPYAMWLTNIAAIILSIFMIYFITDAHYLLGNLRIFGFDLVGSALFGAAIFFTMEWAV